MKRRVLEDVTFTQLRTFECAARAGSFAKAADRLDISQPTVSELIRALEDRLGRTLFQRRNGAAPILTASGQEVLESVSRILNIYDKLFEADRKSHEVTTIRISMGAYLREKFVRPLLPKIYREHPEVEIDLCPMSSWEETIGLIENGMLDLAVLAGPVQMGSPPNARVICELPMVMIASPGTGARLSAGDCSLDEFQYVFPSRRNLGARLAGKLLGDLGITPRASPLFVEFVDVMLGMVEDGKGVGPIQEYLAADRIAAGRLEVLDIALQPTRRLIARSPHAPDIARTIEQVLCEALTIQSAPQAPTVETVPAEVV